MSDDDRKAQYDKSIAEAETKFHKAIDDAPWWAKWPWGFVFAAAMVCSIYLMMS